MCSMMLNGGGGGSGGPEDLRQQQQEQERQDRKRRLARACTARTSARLAPLAPTVERSVRRKSNADDRDFVTALTTPPPLTSLHRRRWLLRSMWEWASVLNFFHVFRPVLNIRVDFTAELLENALITPNSLLDDIHIPLLKAIPPIIRSALGRGTWVTVLCKKLKDWWFWVAEGELPIIASHGEEIMAYKELDPGARVLILKALCEIRVQQEDILRHIDYSLKHGILLSTFRKERIGGDAHGTSFWYEDDPILGHRFYREIRKIEVKNKAKGKSRLSLPIVTCQWETVATNFDEFQDVAEKLVSSRNKMEAAIGKKLKNDILPQLEMLQKRKNRVLKKKQRQAVLLDNFLSSQAPSSGRSLRDRKPVTYTFDDFDRSISEAIKITKKKQPSPEPLLRRFPARSENPEANGKANGKENGNLEYSDAISLSDFGNGSGESDAEHSPVLTRSDRQRRRPQRYSEREFVEAVSDNEADFDSDEEIIGEAVYDEEYIRRRRRKKLYSSSEGDEEYRGDEDSVQEEDDGGDALSPSEDIDDSLNQRWRQRFLNERNRKGRKLKSVEELQSGLRRSRRATRTINYSQYDISNSDEAYAEDFENPPGSGNVIDESKRHSDVSSSADYDMDSEDSLADIAYNPKDKKRLRKSVNIVHASFEKGSVQETIYSTKEVQREPPVDVKKRRFIDLNELAPVAGVDDGPAAQEVKTV